VKKKKSKSKSKHYDKTKQNKTTITNNTPINKQTIQHQYITTRRQGMTEESPFSW